MPLVRLNPTLLALHGRIGDRVYKTYGDGRVIVTRVARFDGYVPSAAQRARRDRMRAATAYAQRVYADPAAKALYTAAAQKLGRCAFRLAISDHLAGRVRVPEAALVSPPITPRAQPPTEHACGCRAGAPNPAGLGAPADDADDRGFAAAEPAVRPYSRYRFVYRDKPRRGAASSTTSKRSTTAPTVTPHSARKARSTTNLCPTNDHKSRSTRIRNIRGRTPRGPRRRGERYWTPRLGPLVTYI